jgi:hypothetical protein
MNCKPGDLAIIVVSPLPQYIGLPVTVLHAGFPRDYAAPYKHFANKPVWIVRSSSLVAVRPFPGSESRVMDTEFAVPDAALRPIRPQPDDAVDETLLWLPVPTKETVPA